MWMNVKVNASVNRTVRTPLGHTSAAVNLVTSGTTGMGAWVELHLFPMSYLLNVLAQDKDSNGAAAKMVCEHLLAL